MEKSEGMHGTEVVREVAKAFKAIKRKRKERERKREQVRKVEMFYFVQNVCGSST